MLPLLPMTQQQMREKKKKKNKKKNEVRPEFRRAFYAKSKDLMKKIGWLSRSISAFFT
jgi:hypothetical protein